MNHKKMEQFGIRENGYQDFLHQTRPKRYLTGLLMLVIVVGFFYTKDFNLPENKLQVIIALAIMVIVFVIVKAKVDKQLRETFESLTISFDGQMITREQYDTPTITLLRTEINEIIQDQYGGFKIIGESRRDLIKIPAQINDNDNLWQLLNKIKPVVFKTQPLITPEEMGSAATVITPMAFILYTDNKEIIILSTIILVFAIIYEIIKAQQDRNLDYNGKRKKWLLLISAYPLFKFIAEKLF